MPTELYHELLSRLSRLRKRREAVALWSGIANGLAAVVVVALVAIAAEWFGHFSIAGRTWLSYSALFLIAGGFFGFVLPPLLVRIGLRARASDDELASAIGAHYPVISDHLVNTMQLARPLFSESSDFYGSPSFAMAAFSNVYGSAKSVDFMAIVDDRPLKRAALLFLSTLVLGFAAFFGAKSDMLAAANRLEHFRTFYQTPAPFTFYVVPGNTRVMRGDSVKVRIYTKGEQLGQVELQTREEGQKNFDALTLTSAPFDSAWAKAHGCNSGFTYILQAEHPLEYFAEARGITSARFHISVLDHPMVRSLTVTVHQPAYTRIRPVQLPENIGDISGVTGTRGVFRVVASKALKKAEILFSYADSVKNGTNRIDTTHLSYPLSIEDSIATGSIAFLKSGSYHIALLDRDSIPNEHPIEYTVSITQDQPPEIVLLEPSDDADLPDDMRLDMLAHIHDDFGFRGARLGYRLSKSKYVRPDSTYTWLVVPLSNYNTQDLDVPYIWNLTPLPIGPGDEMSYVMEVTDNDATTPHTTRTPEYTVRVPTVEEIFKHADAQANKSEENLNEIKQDAQELQKKVDAAVNEMKQLKPSDLASQAQTFSKQKDLQHMVDQQNQLNQRVDQVAKNLQAMTKSLEQQNALSPETMKEYRDLQKLFKQIDSPELKKAMAQLQQAMEKNIDPQKLQAAMKNMKLNEQQFRKSIERTENILRKIQAEQKVDELMKSASELSKQEQKSAENARQKMQQGKQMTPSERAAEARKQQDAQKELDRMRQEMKDVAKEMQKLPQQMQAPNAMKKAAEALADPSTDQEMQQAAQSMQQGNMQQGAEQAQSASHNMSKAEQKLADLQRQMSENARQRAMRKMKQIQDELNRLSKAEEQIKNQAKEAQPNSNVFRKLADQQSEKKDELGQTASQAMQLAQKSTEITPQMGKEMGKAFAGMQKAQDAMTSRNKSGSQQNAESAMASLNKASNAFQKAIQKLAQNGQQGSNGSGGQGQQGQNGMGSGSGDGGMPGSSGQPGQSAMQQFINQINQMAKQQEELNNQMQGMMPGQSGGGEARQKALMRQQAMMNRLEAQQQVVRKSLKQMADEQRQAQTGLHHSADELRKIADEMQQSIGDMKSSGITPATLQRQERILSRLLEAEQSVHRRDKDQQRESIAGQDIVRPSPRALDIASPEAQKELQQEITNARDAGYTPDYNALIRKYFESLEKK